jgi:hypothetical protein
LVKDAIETLDERRRIFEWDAFEEENARDFDPPDPRMIDMSPRGMMA